MYETSLSPNIIHSTENKTKSYFNWYENLDKTSKVRLNINSNLVIFGLAESEATKKSERENHDVDLFAKLIAEINIHHLRFHFHDYLCLFLSHYHHHHVI